MIPISSLFKAEFFCAAVALAGVGVTAAGVGGVDIDASWLVAGAMPLILAAWWQLRKTRAMLRQMVAVTDWAANGNLEPRLLAVRDKGEIKELADAINHLLDRTDAFVREAQASLACMGDGIFYRRIIERGMRGTFKASASIMNGAMKSMSAKFDNFVALTDRFEADVLTVAKEVRSGTTALCGALDVIQSSIATASHQTEVVRAAVSAASNTVVRVASAANGLSASIKDIAQQIERTTLANSQAVAQSAETRHVVESLSHAVHKIDTATALIRDISERTNLLALNATIEAARAGEAGRGFAVVAGEVKALATQTQKATDQIDESIEEVAQASRHSIAAVERFSGLFNELTTATGTIAAAMSEQGEAADEVFRSVLDAAERATSVADASEVLAELTGASQRAAESISGTSQQLGAGFGVLDKTLTSFLKGARSLSQRAA